MSGLDAEIQAWLDDQDAEDTHWQAHVVFMISSKSALNFIDWGLDREGEATHSAAAAVGRSIRAR